MQLPKTLQRLIVAGTVVSSACAVHKQSVYQTYTDKVSVNKGWHVHEGENSLGPYSVWFHQNSSDTNGPIYLVEFDHKGQKMSFDGAFVGGKHKNRDSDGINDPHELWIIKNYKDGFGKEPELRFKFDDCDTGGVSDKYTRERVNLARKYGFEVPNKREIDILSAYAKTLVKEHISHHAGDKSFVFSEVR